MGYEEIARANHRSGNNCSVSLFKDFADKMGMSEAEAARIAPPPRSEGGKCGGFCGCRGKAHYQDRSEQKMTGRFLTEHIY